MARALLFLAMQRNGTPSPPLGNGREETLSEEELAEASRADAPESQGAFASDAFGAIAQGAYGDESFDSSYQRDSTVESVLDPDAALAIVDRPDAEREGPGRGLQGGEWAPQEPLEPPDELARKVLEEESMERRRDDDAIRDDVLDVLSEALPDLRTVDVSVERGEVTLSGTVADRAERLAVYRLAARVPGVVDVSDRLEIAAR